MGYFLTMELQEGTLYIHSLIQHKFEDSCSVDQLLETNLNQSWHANMFCVVQSIGHTVFLNQLGGIFIYNKIHVF